LVSSDQREWFRFLWGGIEGRVPVKKFGASGALTDAKWFPWPEQEDELLDHVAKYSDEDLYTGPATYKANRATKPAAHAVQHVWSDADALDLEKLRLEPSAVVHSSPGKTQLYFTITDCTDPARMEALAHGFTAAHPKDVDGSDHSWAVNKMLRVPGAVNTGYSDPKSEKYIPGAPVHEVTYELTGAVYTYAEFAAAYPPVVSVGIEDKARGELPTVAEAKRSITSFTPKLLELLDKQHAMGVDRSDALFLLQNELFRAGATDEAVFVLCQKHPFNKHRTDERLWEDILRARAKAAGPGPEGGVPDEDEEAEHTTVAPRRVEQFVDFLYPHEKEALEPTFVDDYLAWATSKTDAFPGYHAAGAFTILSCVFADHGHAVPAYAPSGEPLNLWFMVLGDTTRSRKSTAKRMFLSVLKDLEEEGRYEYEVASDFTAEALDNELLNRANRSSLVHVDEFQGFVDAMNNKSYLSGMKGKLTELYDGFVNAKLRATGDAKKRRSVRASFVFWGMGIRDQFADVMDEDDFRSGFLARFLWVQANPPARTPETDYLAQASLTEARTGDPVKAALVEKLSKARAHWGDFHEPGSPTVAVPCTDEAWERLNLFITDVLDAAEGYERRKILEATSSRLSTSILKAATLLAMYDCCDEVELRHMLQAINHGSEWFSHMVFMANKVSASRLLRKQKEITDYLFERGGSATWATAYRKFRGSMGNREFSEQVTNLVEAGLVTLDPDKKIHLTEMASDEGMAA
jgi:hypothetical protein